MVNKYSITEVRFDKSCWKEKELLLEYAEKLTVDRKIPKYRMYYKTVWKESREQNLLTFIMYNPSYANQYFTDDSIQNCIRIALKANYDGIEILNVFAIRHPKSKVVNDKPIKDRNPNNINYDYAQMKNIVLAWGNKTIHYSDNTKLFDKIKNNVKNFSTELYILGIKDNVSTQIKHPASQAWTKLGGIGKAKLIPINKDKFIEQLKKENKQNLVCELK